MIPENYPWNVAHEIYSSGREIGLTNVPSWLQFLSERDFSFGTRIHGNVAAILAGIPALVFYPDARIKELVAYHNIPNMPTKTAIRKSNLSIFDIYEKTDFSQIHRGHKERFNHYIDFLEKNQLPHIFGKERVNRRTAFDDIIESQSYDPGLLPLTTQTPHVQAERLENFYQDLEQKLKEKEKELSYYLQREEKLQEAIGKMPRVAQKIAIQIWNRMLFKKCI